VAKQRLDLPATDRARLRSGSSLAPLYAAATPIPIRASGRTRLAAGEVLCNGRGLRSDFHPNPAGGIRLQWQRPPGWKASVPESLGRSSTNDGDLLVIDSPAAARCSAGGWVPGATLLRLLERRFWRPGFRPAPRPVHRLGRSLRAACLRAPLRHPGWLSAQLRKSDRALAAQVFIGARDQARVLPRSRFFMPLDPRPRSRALPPSPLGQVWCAVLPEAPEL